MKCPNCSSDVTEFLDGGWRCHTCGYIWEEDKPYEGVDR